MTMTQLIESVPNISEGRRPEVIAACADAVRSVPGVTLLDIKPDEAHNRTVLTLIGHPEGLQTAILALYEAALATIDLRQHTGEHPRMGAVDVCPFIPIRGTTMADCVSLAKQVAASVAERWQIPVFLYEEAASASHRRNLADIRRGEFEGLPAKLHLPEWQPDFGGPAPHASFGATVIGAREALVAYNINLNTGSLAVAKAVAKAVRGAVGGLAHVKAMGVMSSDGRAQVSMNLVNTGKTPIYRVFELVRAEAARFGVTPSGSEIIGLVPQQALLDSAAYYLQIENWDPALVLENRVLEHV
ncbi:MAG: glutamate formimidoyltransferase [Candidatus Sericytochromatia bacterium]|nr:glutamate formimidoyltransferase [Candidatus Sericytochromatia bacterium]